MVISVSKSELFGSSSDGGMFLNMKLYNKIKKEDCVAIDGGYVLFLKQFEEICEIKGFDLNDDNFFYPIRKENGINLNKQESHFNDVFGSFRSKIENQFCELHNKFKRFSNNNSTLKTDDIKYITLQIKVCFLLKNIQKFSEKFNIKTQEHHKLWMQSGFNFPSEYKLFDIVYNDSIKQSKKINNLSEIQNKFLNMDINESDNNVNNMLLDTSDIKDNKSESDIDFPQYKNINKKKKKKRKK